MVLFSDFVERAKNGDSDLWLGMLVWYSVSDVKVSHDAVVRALVAAGIDTNLPLPPKDADVFRRVCSKSERKRIPTDQDGIFENFLVRDLNADTEKVHRRVVGEKVDGKGKRLGYEQLADITFDKKTSTISTRKLGPTSIVAEEVVSAVKQGFQAERGTLNSYAVREWIRHFVLGLAATQVRPGGGVYFVSESYHDKLVALEKFCSQIPGNVEFHYLPLIDDKKQREMLQRAFESETADEIDKLLVEITEIKGAGKKITQSRYEDFLKKYHELMSKTESYGELLEEKLSTTQSRLEVFMRSMLELTENHVKFQN
jgi:hypothetical protein